MLFSYHSLSDLEKKLFDSERTDSEKTDSETEYSPTNNEKYIWFYQDSKYLFHLLYLLIVILFLVFIFIILANYTYVL